MSDLIEQEQLTKDICTLIRQLADEYRGEMETYWDHRHMCTFELLENSKRKWKRSCKKYLKEHPVTMPQNYPQEYLEDDKCEFCPMFNYVALDDHDRIMYIIRTFPEEILEFYNKENKV